MRAIALLLFTATVWAQQDPNLQSAVSEAGRLRQWRATPDEKISDSEQRHFSANLHRSLRDWIESRLPQSKDALDRELPLLQTGLKAELWRVGLLAPEQKYDLEYGYVRDVEVTRPAEYPEALKVVVGATVPCGVDDVVYIYDYSTGFRRRVLESPGHRDHDETVSGVYFAGDADNRLILTLRYAVQCASAWNGLSYDLYRLTPASAEVVPILVGEHGYYGYEYELRLKADDLLLELKDRSIDGGLHSRTHILHYRIGPDTAERVDPVALQPQDFVDEWLTRPWEEMKSRSALSAQDQLEKWHKLASRFGEFDKVQPCSEKPDHLQVAVNVDYLGENELPEPLTLFFLVHQTGPYQFEMAGVSFDEHEGCDGETPPNSDSPWLKGEQLEALTRSAGRILMQQ
jgi:hypothetical protein